MISRSYRRRDKASSRYVSAIIASELATNTTAYHSARRKPSVCCRRSRHLENIPEAPHGLNHLLVEALVHLLTHAVHEHIDDVRPGIEAVVPHVRDDHGLRNRASGVPHQVLEQSELPWPQRLERASRT